MMRRGLAALPLRAIARRCRRPDAQPTKNPRPSRQIFPEGVRISSRAQLDEFGPGPKSRGEL
jgi:hypothetical protein